MTSVKYHYSSLRVYQTANLLVHLVFDLTASFPKEEMYVTVAQLRRAALSIVLNIVEGSGKRTASTIEFLRFLKISFGSLHETEYLLQFSFDRGYLTAQNFEKVSKLRNKCGAELWKLMESLRK